MILLQWLTLATLRGARPQAQKRLAGNTVLLMEWSEEGVWFTQAELHRGGWTTASECFVPLPQDEDADRFVVSSIRRIQQELRRHSVNAKQVLVTVSRRKAVIKLLELPFVDPSQLPEAVSLQAEARGQTAQNYSVDFIPQPTQSDESQYVLMAAYPRPALLCIEKILTGLGLEPAFIGLGEMSAGIAMPSTESDSAQLLLIATKSKIEFIVTRKQHPVTAFSVAMEYDVDQLTKVLGGTLKRLQSSLPQELIPNGFDAISAIGEAAPVVVSVLKSKFQFAVGTIACPIPKMPAAWILLCGAHIDFAGMNFLHPRQNIDISAGKRQSLIKLGTRVALVVFLLFLCFQWWLKQLDNRTSLLQQNLTQLQNEVNGYEENLEAERKLLDWRNAKLDLPAELDFLLQQLPNNDRLFLQQVRVDSPPDQAASITFEGVARDSSDALGFTRDLLQHRSRYALQPESIERNEQDPHYHTKFNVSVTLESGESTQSSEAEGQP